MELNSKTILVAGGTDGLGLEIVKTLVADAGNEVYVVGRNDKNISAFKDKVSFFPLDITKEKDVAQFAQNFKIQLDVLIVSVGIFGHGLLAGFSYEQIRQSIETNLLGHIFLTRALLPNLKTQSRLISINSISGVNPTKERSLLCGAKWGLRGFYYSLAEELKEKMIMVTQAFPGFFDSGYMDKVGIPKDKSKAISKTVLAQEIVRLCQLPENVYVSEYHIKNISYA